VELIKIENNFVKSTKKNFAFNCLQRNTDKTSNDMKDKIKDIIISVEMTTIEPEEAVNKLFDLFVVSQRSELFKSFLQKVVQETEVGDLTWQTRDEAKELLKLLNCC